MVVSIVVLVAYNQKQ